MIINLFSIFDPSTSEYLRINWLSIFLSFIFIPIDYYFISSLVNIFFIEIILKLYEEFLVFLKRTIRGLFFSSIFIFIFCLNFVGLFPYIFTITTHLVFTLRFALTLWLRFIFYGWYNFTDLIFRHLVPRGTPPALIPFIVLIETIRLIIRPITLSVRLAANIIAGHLLLCLIGSTGTLVGIILLLLVLLSQAGLYLLETGVTFIQAYVFSVLRALYCQEVDIRSRLIRWFSLTHVYIKYKIAEFSNNLLFKLNNENSLYENF